MKQYEDFVNEVLKDKEEGNQIFDEEEEIECRSCGCTWNNACPGGCYWVEANLCSNCVNEDETQ